MYASVVTGKPLRVVAQEELVAKTARKPLWPTLNVENLKKRCHTIVKTALRGLNLLYPSTASATTQVMAVSPHDIMTASFSIALRLRAAFPSLSAATKIAHQHIQETFISSRSEVHDLLAIMAKTDDDYMAQISKFLQRNLDALKSLSEFPFDDWPMLLDNLDPEPVNASDADLQSDVNSDDEGQDQGEDEDRNSESADDSPGDDSANRLRGPLGPSSSLTEKAAFFKEMFREAMAFSAITRLQGLACLGSPDMPVIAGFVLHSANEVGNLDGDASSRFVDQFLRDLSTETGLPYVTRHCEKTSVHNQPSSTLSIASVGTILSPTVGTPVTQVPMSTPIMTMSAQPMAVTHPPIGPPGTAASGSPIGTTGTTVSGTATCGTAASGTAASGPPVSTPGTTVSDPPMAVSAPPIGTPGMTVSTPPIGTPGTTVSAPFISAPGTTVSDPPVAVAEGTSVSNRDQDLEVLSSTVFMQCKFGPGRHKLLGASQKTRKGATSKKQDRPATITFVCS